MYVASQLDIMDYLANCFCIYVCSIVNFKIFMIADISFLHFQYSCHVIIILLQIQEYIPIKLVQVSCVLLGLGVLLLWCGLFGILSYFESLNVSDFNNMASYVHNQLCYIILFIASQPDTHIAMYIIQWLSCIVYRYC